MNITFVNRFAGIWLGGGEIVELGMAKALRARGHSVRLLTGRRVSRVGNRLLGMPTTYVRTPYLRSAMYKGESSNSHLVRAMGYRAARLDIWMFEQEAKRLIRRDRVHECTDIFHLSGLPRLGAWITSRLGGKSVVIWHGRPGPSQKHWSMRCSGTLAVGDSYECVRDTVDDRARLLLPGVDTETYRHDDVARRRLREICHVGEEEVVFLYVGRMIPVKNISFLMEGFALLHQERPLTKLVLLGEGTELNHLRGLATRLGLCDSVNFAGWRDGAELVAFYSLADVLCLTSHYETYSLVIREGMSCSLPVVATRVGGVATAFRSGACGCAVELGDLRGLCTAMKSLTDCPELRQSMGESNRALAVKEFGWDKCIDSVMDYYAALRSNTTRPACRQESEPRE